MNTAGHRKIAEDVGNNLLEQAFERAHPGSDPRVGAFYLGNWLTDVSQIYDPVAMTNFRDKITLYFEQVTTELLNTSDRSLNSIRRQLNRSSRSLSGALREIREQIEQSVNIDIGPDAEDFATRISRRVDQEIRDINSWITLALNNLRNQLWEDLQAITDPSLQEISRDVFQVIGFFKFVHPASDIGDRNSRDSGRSIDYTAFLSIISRHYTQYYPHEHLDRPELLDQSRPNHPKFASEMDDQDTFIYKYLVDDIKVTAALLGKLDRDWASNVFRQSNPPVNDGADDYNLALAQLGHALHNVEDFFAHSNFVEHAATSMGPEHLSWRRIAEGQHRRVFERRLKRVPHPGWEQPGRPVDETHIVTGFFDVADTLHSLSHALEEFLSEHEFLGVVADIAGAHQDEHVMAQQAGLTLERVRELIANPDLLAGTAEEKAEELTNIAKKYLTWTLELYDDKDKAYADRHNAVAQYVFSLEGHPVDPRTEGVAGKLWDHLGLQRHSEIRRSFVQSVERLTTTIHRGQAAWSIYKAYKFIAKFYRALRAGGVGAFVMLLKELMADQILSAIKDNLLEIVATNVKHELGRRMGAERYGCHTLLAKDTGHETMAHFSNATASLVHWHVISTLTRYSQRQQIWSARRPPQAAADAPDERNAFNRERWVDWNQLLFFFLRHPTRLTGTRRPFTVETVDHQVQPGEYLGQITEQYMSRGRSGQIGTVQDTPESDFSLFQLAEWNNLPEDPTIRPLEDYGISHLHVHNVLVEIPESDPRSHVNAWWRPIIEYHDDSRLRNFGSQLSEQGRTLIAQWNRTYGTSFHAIQWIPLEELNNRITQGLELLDRLNTAYEPPSSPRFHGFYTR